MVRSCAVLLLAVAVAAQSDRPSAAQTKGRPKPGSGPGIVMPPAVQVQPQPGTDQVPDWRVYILGHHKKLLPMGPNPELLKKLMEDLPKDKADPEQIKGVLEKNQQLKDPAFLNQLKGLIDDDFPKGLNQKLPEGVPQVPNNDDHVKENIKENLQKVIEEGQKNPPPLKGGPKGDPVTPPKFDPPKGDLPKLDPSTTNPASQNEWVQWMQKHFGESPAGQQAIKDLMSAIEKQDMKGMFDKVPEFENGGWKDIDSWGKANAGGLWNLKPPNVSGPKMTPPKIGAGGSSGLGGGGGGSSSGGGLGGGGGGLGGGGSALAVVAALGGAILLAVLLFRNWKVNQAERAAAAAAGRAGLDFDAIRTREQLVQAFDRVSLEQIGDEARPWNHRVVADQIAEARPAQAEPADELAGLYERARYAPADEDLTAGEFSSARRDLRVIAGVTA